MTQEETWERNQKFVLSALDKIDRKLDSSISEFQKGMYDIRVEIKDEHKDIAKEIKDIHKDMTDIKVQIGMLKVKSGTFGFIGGALALLIAVLTGYFK